MIVSLPVVVPPTLSGLQFYAHPLAIIETIPQSLDWIYSNFIQLAYNDSTPTRTPMSFYIHDYAQCPWLETLRLTQEWLNLDGHGFVDFVCKQNALNYYVHTSVDEYYIEGRWAFGVEHYSHDILTHEVDDSRELIAVLGYNASGKYVSTHVTFDLMAKAWDFHREMASDNPDVILYRARPQGHYPLNRELIARTLSEYLTGSNTAEHFAAETPVPDIHYGMSIYEPLRTDLSSALAQGQRPDPRGVHVLWEHKRLMTRRVAATVSSGALGETSRLAADLERRCLILKLATVAAYSLGNFQYLERELVQFDTIRQLDEKFVSDYLLELNSAP